jgi:uncharacterized protein
MLDTVIVVAKQPLPGQVKTRLTPPLTPDQAADVAAACIADTLATVGSWPAHRHVLLLDGVVPNRLRGDFEIWPQVPGSLDVRLAAAFDRATGPTLLVGMDTPQLRARHVSAVLARDAWDGSDAYLGPADDGGFWAIAMATPQPGPLLGVPMSTPATGQLQRRRLEAVGMRVAMLPALRDIDTAIDAAAVAAGVPDSRFGQFWRTMTTRSAIV